MEIILFSPLKRFQVSTRLRLRSPLLAHMAHVEHMAHTARTSCCLLLAYGCFRFLSPLSRAHTAQWCIWRTQLVLPVVFYSLTAFFGSVSPLSRAHMAHWRISWRTQLYILLCFTCLKLSSAPPPFKHGAHSSYSCYLLLA